MSIMGQGPVFDLMRDIEARSSARRDAVYEAERMRVRACNCVGPQNGQPKCPCAMQGVIIRDGRYIQPEQDLGPVKGEDG